MKNKIGLFSLIIGLFVLICGVFLVFTPLEAYVMVTFIIPFAIIFHGVSGVISYIGDKKTKAVTGWLLADGLISVIIGLWLLVSPGRVALALPYVFGFWVLFGGTLRIVGSVAMKNASKTWGLVLLLGVIGVASGIILLNHPYFSETIIAYLVAWSFIFMGIQGIMNFFVIRSK